ncbi:MAG: hypothetical protein KJZ65_13710 [Phycisphaerales bacterium]|nr:hypothetical protein [Phycisphaerales bacterium]
MRLSAQVTAVGGAIAGLAAVTTAAPILSFGFTDLAGSFSTGSGVFQANASDTAALSTSGDVTRLAGPIGTANFDTGFLTASAFADVNITMNVSIIDAQNASGVGSFTLTDDDGDTITGTINGTFHTPGYGITFFTGLLSNVMLSGTTFDGPDGGSFDMDLPGNAPYPGAFVALYILNGTSFFNRDFREVSVQVNGEILPSAGSMSLLALGGLVASRRQRRS